MLPTDYMLLSPKVDVFRNDSLELLEEPYSLAVISIAAPNLAGRGRLIRKEIIDDYMIRRIRQYFEVQCILWISDYNFRCMGMRGI